MEHLGNLIMKVIETGGLFAPILFICFHLFRPIFFLPVAVICIWGGVVFGPIAGTIYSVIGMTISCLMFYGIIRWMPKTLAKLRRLKHKLIGSYSSLTTSQIAFLRLIPLIHFHLLSLCLIDISDNFKHYLKSSFLTNIPLAFIYTSVGRWFSNISPLYTGVFLVILLLLIYILRQKEMTIKWHDFFRQIST